MAFKIITTALTVEQTTSLDQTTNYLMKNILSDIHLPCYMQKKGLPMEQCDVLGRAHQTVLSMIVGVR